VSRAKLSVLLPTYNCADIVQDTLESVRWADEILVVDSFSTDGTLDVCRKYTDRIIQHEYVNSATQKNWALSQCRYEWILQIDTDERLEPGLREEIEMALANTPSDVHAYRIPRKNHILGRWLLYGGLYPDYQTRLFRRDEGRWQDKEVHAHVVVPGKVGPLRHHILHYGMPHISKQLRNLDRYTRYEADELSKRGERFHWWYLGLRPLAIFVYNYIWRQGFRVGYRGLLIAAFETTFQFWAHAKLWELEELNLERSPK
jgi:glycosyltransferase involved in cell wall biosynthesis